MSNIGIYGARPARTNKAVRVISSTSVEGVVTPLEIVWEDGRHFRIDRVLDRRRAQSLKHGGKGMRYRVQIGNTATYLWFDGLIWSVDEKVQAGETDWGC